MAGMCVGRGTWCVGRTQLGENGQWLPRACPDSRILSRKTKYIQIVERVAEHVLSAERLAATTVLQQKLMQSAGARNEMRKQLGELRSQRRTGLGVGVDARNLERPAQCTGKESALGENGWW